MRLLLTIALLFSGTLASCASTARDRSDRKPVGDPRAVAIFRGDGSAAQWAELVGAASSADVVLSGENHGHPLGLAAAAALWTDILIQSHKAALAMEFFERDEQVLLDDYLDGVTDEAGFLKAAHRNDLSFPRGHRLMVNAAQHAKRPVIAANAPRRYVKLARTDGYDRLRGLTAEQQRCFAIPDSLPTGRYRDDFSKLMTDKEAKDPAEEAKRVEGMFRAQSMWDWTMAQSLVRSFDAGNTPTMLVVGRFHSDFYGGTCIAVKAQKPGAKVVTVSFVDRFETKLSDEDRERADFVVYVGPVDEPKK